ncbi:MAG: hypothetical protein NTU41_01115 [Chloroflexi bacterium]|nr:hypothetical protein [Chloroflexota bacterium]
MSQLMSWLNMLAGLVLFFAMSGITDWVIFATPAAKVFPFLIAILLLGNAVYLALGKGESFARRG